MTVPVILDVDTGVDDACAILLAALHPALDLRAVTCVGGNVDVDSVVANTLTVLDAAGREDVVVARGAERPLLRSPEVRVDHGEDGMGDLDWPRSTREPVPRHAVEVLRDVLLAAAEHGDEAHRVTLVPLAPLTNIALLLRTHPGAARGVREIVFMGGAARVDDVTVSAEFNVSHDPEAAAVVLDACADLEIPVTMYGLDVFYGPQVALETARALVSAGGGGATELGGRLVEFQCQRFGSDSATVGDAGAVCAVIEPGGVTRRRLPVRIELADPRSRGRTIVGDWGSAADRNADGQAGSAVDVCLEVDARRFATLWLDTVSGGMR